MGMNIAQRISEAWGDLLGTDVVVRENKRLLTTLGIGPIQRMIGIGRFTSMSEDDLAGRLLKYDPNLQNLDNARKAIPEFVGEPLYMTSWETDFGTRYVEDYVIRSIITGTGETRYVVSLPDDGP